MRHAAFILMAALAGATVHAQGVSLSKAVLDAMGDRQHPGWDRNFDGVLAPRELAVAINDPGTLGPKAAAAAALHVWFVTQPPAKSPRLTRQWFELLGAEADPADPALARAVGKARQELPAQYYMATDRIRHVPRELWSESGPSYTDIRQGDLGDCELLAPLAALAHRDPSAIRAMISLVEPAPGVARMGQPEQPARPVYRVVFGDGRTVEVAAPTIAELALPGASVRNGLWVRVVEKAFACRRIPMEVRAYRCAYDELNQGGDAGEAGAALTGHVLDPTVLVGDAKKELPSHRFDAGVSVVRARISQGLAANRVVLVSTGTAVPPGLIAGHAYAVLGLDDKTDTLELFNTWSETFQPKGEPGVTNGYPHAKGVTHIPLKDFSRIFTLLYVESDRPGKGP